MHAPSHSQPLRRQRLFATILLTFLASIPLQIASAVSTHSEDAESGLGGVIDGSDASYALIQSDQVAQGANAFHLANPAFTDNSFTLDVDIDVLADTKLFFQSRLQWATPFQFATVQVSHDGGSTWPDTVYSQAGTGGSGEGAFSLRTIDLGAPYLGQQIRLRFYYDFTNTSAITQTTTDVGWLVDDIQIGTSFLKTLWSIGTPTATEVLYLEVINRARADALVEAARLAALTDPDIIGAYTDFGITTANIPIQFSWYVTNGCMSQFAQPLAFDAKLMETAQKHTQDMFNNMFQGHNSSASPIAPFLPGDTFGDRLSRVGWSNGAAGENVFAYAESVEYGHAGFDVDWGNDTNNLDPCYNADFAGQGMQNPSGHRTNLHNPDSKEAGIGVINGTNGSVGPQLVTQDLGSNSGAAYITGVVYDDDDSNGIYSATSDMSHEGRSGIRVDIDGSPLYAITTTSGAYALPVTANGTYTVTFSGAGIQTFVTTANITGLQNVKLDHNPVDLTEKFGLFTYSVVGGTTIEITDYPEDAVGPAEIPAMIDGKSVTSIGDSAFEDCSVLTSVTIPSSVTSIGDSAFHRCSALTSVTIPSSVTSIGYRAFFNCSALTSVTIPSSVTSIGDSAFEDCSALTAAVFLGDAPSLGSLVFSNTAAGFTIYYLSGSTSFTTPMWEGYPALPLDGEVFGLFTYSVVGPTTIEITGYPEDAVGPAEIPAMIDGKSVTSIGDSAFEDCSVLTSVTIPSSVTSIGDSAFHRCSALTSVTIPSSVTSIGYRAFFNCSALTSVTIPSSVTSIGDWAFFNCSALTSVTIPSSVTSIGDLVFLNCSALTSVTIPSSVTSIGQGAFNNCSALTSVTIPEGVTSIGDWAFLNCSALTSVTTPSSVTSIGDHAFSNCSALTSVTIREGVTSIGYSAFENCSALTVAVFLGDAPSLGSSVFSRTAAGFTSYYLSGSTGLTTPTWEGYAALPIDEALYPAASWLLGHRYPHTTNLDQDTNGDGVSLLMAYALNLNPNLNLAGSLPAPVLDGATLSMSFHAASPGITYSVETSIDLNTWVTEGVTISGPDNDNQRTASVAMDLPQRFLRLVVQQ